MLSRPNAFLAPVLAGLLALAACHEPVAPTNGEVDGSGPSATPPLLFAVHPYDSPKRLVERYQPLCDYLGLRLGRPVRLYLAHSYGDEIRRIVHGQVDLAYLGPTPYLRARDHYLGGASEGNLQLLAGETRDGVAGYRGVIVALANGPIRSLSDLRGETLAFGSPRSYSGHYVPRILLARVGLSLADLKDYAYLERHERVALAVAHGDFVAGALREDVAELYLDRGLRIIARSDLLPPHVVVARPGLDEGLAAAVRTALVEPNGDGARAFAALGREVGFAPVEDARFDSVRATVRTVEGFLPAGTGP